MASVISTNWATGLFILFSSLILSGCPKRSTTFDDDGILEANIRRTDYGVPHIKAQNLESLSFGTGYAFAQDNVCMALDIVTRYNSRRSQYLGPDKVMGSGDSQNLITDFGYLALGIREQAERGYDQLTDETKAMLSGYSKGINYYLQQTGAENIDPNCAGKPWVQPITELDMLTSLLGIALLPGSANFMGAIFLAAPPGTNFIPTPIVAQNQSKKTLQLQPQIAVNMPQPNEAGLASNAWAIGKNLSANQKGLLLANPHFPHTGIMRFWQFHNTIPGVLDVTGVSLSGTPGMVNVGFNKDIAWSHTFSTAEHVIVYKLDLNRDDASGLSYIKDGDTHAITKRELVVNVAVAPGVVMPFSKTAYYSEFGPMIMVPGALPWGEDSQGEMVAFSVKDANKENFDIVDHWLAMNMATNMKEFKQSFKQFNGMLFNNTLAVDKHGNTFFIDDSAVPHIGPAAETALRTSPELVAARELLGFSVLPGNASIFDFDGPVPYEMAPKMENTTLVQNSNDSYWLTHLDSPMPNHSILYGKTNNEQSLRSRMGQIMIQDSAGEDNLFSLDEIQTALFSERAYLAEAILDELISICESQGSEPIAIEIPGEEAAPMIEINIQPGCEALANWDGHFFKSSQSAHVFREFAEQFKKDPQWAIEFDPLDPVNTPNGLLNNEITLQQFARAIYTIEQAGVSLYATLGEVQFVELTNPDGTPSGNRLPWEGANNIEGGFNVFDQRFKDDLSNIPRYQYPPLPGSQISAEGKGYQISRGTSWIMLVSFTDEGPQARGLLTYSQSIDSTSPHWDDQARLYSKGPQLRPVLFKEKDIRKHVVSELKITLNTNQ